MATRYYAIKRPDGSWIMAKAERYKSYAWFAAIHEENTLTVHRGPWHSPRRQWWRAAESAGYRCCEVSGFVEVDNG